MDIMDNAALLSEITDDPAALGYAGKTAQQQADLGNTQSIPYDVIVDTWVVHNFLLGSGIYGKLLDAYHNNANEQVRIIAEEAIDTVMGQIPQLDVNSNSTIVQGMEALEQAGVLTQGDANSIIALGQRHRSRFEQLWGDGTVVTAPQITAALLQPKRDSIASLSRQAGNGYNLVATHLGDLTNQLDAGTDVTVPAWSDLTTLFGTGTDTGGPF